MLIRHRSTPVLRRIALGAGSVALLTLTACSGDSTDSDAAESSSAAPETSADAGADAAADSSPAGTGEHPDWAEPVTTPGTKIATVAAGDLTVDVYQVGTAAATDTGFFADPTTNQPLIAVGDQLVFVNYVVTNGGAPVDLGASLVTIDATYDDWPYLQGMDGLSEAALFEAQGVHSSGLAAGSFRDPAVYTLGTGQSFSYAENFEHQPGSPITFEVDYTPVDAAGDLLHDQRVEGSGTGVIS